MNRLKENLSLLIKDIKDVISYIKNEKDPIERLKHKYMLYSLILTPWYMMIVFPVCILLAFGIHLSIKEQKNVFKDIDLDMDLELPWKIFAIPIIYLAFLLSSKEMKELERLKEIEDKITLCVNEMNGDDHGNHL